MEELSQKVSVARKLATDVKILRKCILADIFLLLSPTRQILKYKCAQAENINFWESWSKTLKARNEMSFLFAGKFLRWDNISIFLTLIQFCLMKIDRWLIVSSFVSLRSPHLPLQTHLETLHRLQQKHKIDFQFLAINSKSRNHWENQKN